MRRLIYLDNLVVRRLILEDPHYSNEQRQRLVDFYKKTFGISCFFAQCPYLFLEFIGCTKSKLGISYTSSLLINKNICLKSTTDDQVKDIDKSLVKELKKINRFVQYNINRNKEIIKNRLKATLERVKKDPFSQKMLTQAFGNYIWTFKNSFKNFLEILTKAITWDVFITLKTTNLKVLRERQLGYWYQNYNPDFPFGKIIDDLKDYYDYKFPEKNFLLKAREDMVDSKMMTLSVTGYRQGDFVRRVDVVTYDINATGERAKLSLGSIKNIEESLGISIPKKFGQIYCLSEPETSTETESLRVEIIQNQNIIKL